jgi:hypothetical protein
MVAGVDPATGRLLTASEINALRPWPHINGTFTYSDDIGMARYNSVQLKLQQRMADSITSLVSYTWSRSIDTSSGWFGVENGIGGGSAVQNYWDIDSNRSVSSYDIPHIFTWAAVWDLPFGQGKRWLTTGPASWVLGNWQVNWFLLMRSGQPFTPTVGGDPANIGVTGYGRPHLVGDPELDNPTSDQWFNVAAYTVPRGEFGNAERNSLRAPGYWNVDFSVSKRFATVGRQYLLFRGEMFNVLNHPNFSNPMLPNFAIDFLQNGIDPETNRGIGFLPLTATPDVGGGNPFLGGGGPRAFQLAARVSF